MYNQNLFSRKKHPYTKIIIIIMAAFSVLGFGFWLSQTESESKISAAAGGEVDQKTEFTKKVKKSPITEGLVSEKMHITGAGFSDGYESNGLSTTGGITTTEGLNNGKGKDSDLETAKLDDEMIEKASKAYYLVKEVDGLVKIFYYSTEGDEKMIRITAIPYELLAKPDQSLFKTGIMKYSIDELNELLQDFES